MKVRINIPEITKDSFERIWLDYTITRLSNLRFSCYRDFQSSRFSDGISLVDGPDFRVQSVLAFAYCRLRERVGYENEKIRNLRKFRNGYLVEVKKIWSEYYDGIRSSDLPWMSERSFRKFDYYWFMHENQYLRICQAFFVKWNGRDIKRLLKPNCKAIATPILEQNFDEFFNAMVKIDTSKTRFKYFHYPVNDRLFLRVFK